MCNCSICPIFSLKEANKRFDDFRRKKEEDDKMAYVHSVRTADAGITDRISAVFKDLGERYSQYATYRKTLRELGELSNRELADLGIHRSSLRAIAIEAAYGA
ncbi:MAG: hypothetical protein ACJA2X_000183 [Halocynthiibacter sp.]